MAASKTNVAHSHLCAVVPPTFSSWPLLPVPSLAPHPQTGECCPPRLTICIEPSCVWSCRLATFGHNLAAMQTAGRSWSAFAAARMTSATPKTIGRPHRWRPAAAAAGACCGSSLFASCFFHCCCRCSSTMSAQCAADGMGNLPCFYLIEGHWNILSCAYHSLLLTVVVVAAHVKRKSRNCLVKKKYSIGLAKAFTFDRKFTKSLANTKHCEMNGWETQGMFVPFVPLCSPSPSTDWLILVLTQIHKAND